MSGFAPARTFVTRREKKTEEEY